MHWRKFEDQVCAQSAKIRTRLFSPLLKLFATIGITPNFLTGCSILVMALFVYVIHLNTLYAFGCLLLRAIFDTLDGSLARHLHIHSDRGKFTDIVADSIGFALFLAGITSVGLLNGVLAVCLAFFLLLLKIFEIICRNIGHHTDWIIHPMAGTFTNLFPDAFYILFVLFLLRWAQFFNLLAILSLILIIPKLVFDYITLQKMGSHTNP